MNRPDAPLGELEAGLGLPRLRSDRVEFRRQIGAGAFGTVFEGFDVERRTPVAIKWLSRVDGDTVHRFKHEFRSLADLSHPNLVQLFDLMGEDEDHWYFTMELVRGVSLPAYFRPETFDEAPTRDPSGDTQIDRPLRAERVSGIGLIGSRTFDVDEKEVVEIYRQLALGVSALHQAGKLHRDLKCQNVMVTPAGRVVLLDFGLVLDAHPRRFETPQNTEVAGTPLYMAPEQYSGAPVEPAVDWYAFGVMLFRTLTGGLPFQGSSTQVLLNKQRDDPPRPSSRADGVPRALDELCHRLLARRPEERPTGSEVLSALGTRAQPSSLTQRHVETDVFVGRRRELRSLEGARRRVQLGEPAVVYVPGVSGIGKTALVRHFLWRLHAAEPRTWILEGRCYEQERLPYKALDAIVDGLAARLRERPAVELEALVPEHLDELIRMFPTLGRVPVFAERAEPMLVPDPQEQRRRAALALRELFAGVAATRPLVLFIDDLHWADPDSAALLRPLWKEPEGPPILWVSTYREEEAATSPVLRALGVIADDGLSPWEARVDVRDLQEEEARTLLELRLDDTPRDEEVLDALCRDAAGSPLFLDLLVRHAREEPTGTGVDVAAVLDERLSGLPDIARTLLELLAVRGAPLDRSAALAAVGGDDIGASALARLSNGRWLRVRETDAGSHLELYHDRIRTWLLDELPAPRERRHHGSLLQALATSGVEDPEVLAFHHRGAGDLARALHHTLTAARRADRALAFERAAQLYREALDLRKQVSRGPTEALDEGELLTALGEALRNAGRGREAADAFLQAANVREGRDAIELRRRAAEQFLFSGHLDEGREALGEVLRAVGLRFPTQTVWAVAALLLRRAQVRWRGLDFTRRPPESIAEAEQLRIDTCWAASVGLAMIDPVRGGLYQSRHLLMALEAGDPERVARAVAVEVPFSAVSGAKTKARTESLRQLGESLAAEIDSPYVRGLLASSTGGAAWLEGRWLDALALEEKALTILRGECHGVSWQLSSSTIVLLDTLWRTGRWDELYARVPAILDDAVARGDLLLEIYLRMKFVALSRLVHDRPEEAMREAREALARWSQPTFQLLHLWELHIRVEAHLYAGHPRLAQAAIDSQWRALERSQLLSLEMYDITMRDLAGRAAVAMATVTEGTEKRRWLSKATANARRLEQTGAPWGAALAKLLRAGVASFTGRAQALPVLEAAVRALAGLDMTLPMNAAAIRLARLTGESPGAALSAMPGVGADPWLSVWAPGDWAD